MKLSFFKIFLVFLYECCKITLFYKFYIQKKRTKPFGKVRVQGEF